MQVLLIAVLAFAALWYTALRPKPPAASEPAKPAAAQPAPATPAKSAIPGAPGKAVDGARAAKADGDAAATTRSAQAAGAADRPAPVQVAAAKPAKAAAPATRPVRVPARSAGPTAQIARSLARGNVVVLLFYSAGSDDRVVRSQVAGVASRRGRVRTWPVPVRRLSRYRDVLQGVQVLQTPSIVMLRRASRPILLTGYTDRAEIDKVAASLLRRP